MPKSNDAETSAFIAGAMRLLPSDQYREECLKLSKEFGSEKP